MPKHTTTITLTPVEPETPYRDGIYAFTCTCGERATYSGYWFTYWEAERHRRYHEA